MKALFPVHALITFPLLIIQVYLLVYLSLLLLRRMKLLKQPYNGMDHPESLFAGIVMLGVLFISSADATGLFQAVKSYSDNETPMGESCFLFFARSFVIILSFNLLFVILNFLNARFLFRGYYEAPGFPISILLSAIAIGLALACWFTCQELVDNMTPKLINFQ